MLSPPGMSLTHIASNPAFSAATATSATRSGGRVPVSPRERDPCIVVMLRACPHRPGAATDDAGPASQAAAAGSRVTVTDRAPSGAAIATVSPPASSPDTSRSATRSSISRWISRRSGRAPYSGSYP